MNYTESGVAIRQQAGISLSKTAVELSVERNVNTRGVDAYLD
jgi:hypothetical protein